MLSLISGVVTVHYLPPSVHSRECRAGTYQHCYRRDLVLYEAAMSGTKRWSGYSSKDPSKSLAPSLVPGCDRERLGKVIITESRGCGE